MKRRSQFWVLILLACLVSSVCIVVYEKYFSASAHQPFLNRDDLPTARKFVSPAIKKKRPGLHVEVEDASVPPRRKTASIFNNQHKRMKSSSVFHNQHTQIKSSIHAATQTRKATPSIHKQSNQGIPLVDDNHPKKIGKFARVHNCTLFNETITLPQAPDFIIAGAQKSGTSVLYYLLRRHPSIIPSDKFEVHMFDWHFAVPPDDLKKPSFWKKFNASNEQELLCSVRKKYIEENFDVDRLLYNPPRPLISFEKTPNYMFLPKVPELIKRTCPWNVKIIIILRNPVDRAYSHYSMDSMTAATDESFEDLIQKELQVMRDVGLTNAPIVPVEQWDLMNETMNRLFDSPPQMTRKECDDAHWWVYRRRHMRNYLQRGVYAAQLERWIQHFPLGETLLIVSNERFLRDKRSVIREILEFVGAPHPTYFDDLGISLTPPADDATDTFKLFSVGGYNPMSNATRRLLEKFYKPYNKQLEDLLGETWRPNW